MPNPSQPTYLLQTTYAGHLSGPRRRVWARFKDAGPAPMAHPDTGPGNTHQHPPIEHPCRPAGISVADPHHFPPVRNGVDYLASVIDHSTYV